MDELNLSTKRSELWHSYDGAHFFCKGLLTSLSWPQDPVGDVLFTAETFPDRLVASWAKHQNYPTYSPYEKLLIWAPKIDRQLSLNQDF